jgi:hypothetical protein
VLLAIFALGHADQLRTVMKAEKAQPLLNKSDEERSLSGSRPYLA